MRTSHRRIGIRASWWAGSSVTARAARGARSGVWIRARAALLTLVAVLSTVPVAAQMPPAEGWVGGPGSANYQLAARFAPYRISELLHSTTVTPRWIEEGDRFWYEWETGEGTFYYIVDPAEGTKRQIFDNDVIAAELTRITRDPWDGQHLPIRNIRFIDDYSLEFEVESSQDEEVEAEEDEVDEEEQRDERERDRQARPRTKKKVHHFQYDVRTQTLRELEDWEEPDLHPAWATVSPDTAWVVFSREANLWMMSYAEYMKIVEARKGKTGDDIDEAEEEVEVEETQLTTDGEKDYSYGNAGRGDDDEETAEEFKKRQNAGVTFSHDSRWFALTRQDRREVGDLWVVHATGNKRPKLETYKYDMPGEEDVTQTELLVFDMDSREMKSIDDEPWKDQRMGVYSEPGQGGGFGGGGGGGGGGRDEPNIRKWLSDRPDELYFWRRSRDQHRVDLM
ncbi:MAG TPA: DPP IV N-terminal domain-containing protein, partial [Longimicrobiales bacterium]